ncbi:hypothetical protein GCM10022252_79120 [Streptosporangium oxazolinicum]|uniref:DNA-binding protein n=1 Tax=Streptosporangium oxazolinicum TaxID=909287 RepID=A0ABP8BMX8_9ACTN
MSLYSYHPVANGLRTDHPIPELPFVDDRHLPLEDPAAIEDIGRNKGEGMWGREDKCKDGGWVAFTTDAVRHDLAWVVRWHPEHGRAVLLYRDEDAASVHSVLMYDGSTAMVFRAGGYWWDGVTWYRPGQLWNAAAEQFYRRPVPAAMTVTAKDLLPGGDPARSRLLSITDVDVEAAPSGRWRDDLALWASHREGDLADSVVTLTAPELTGDQLVGLAEMAQIAGIAASTLRAYISRGEGDVPLPQATVHGRSAWARPVAEEWAEQRRRSRDGVDEAVSAARQGNSLPVGVAETWTRFSRNFFSLLWEHPTWRKRWALRWRTEASVQEIAEALSWEVAGDISKLVPVYDLATTIRQAMLHEFAIGMELHDDGESGQRDYDYFGITPAVAKTLDWLIRHNPATAGRTIEQIIGEASRQLNIPRHVSERSITTALQLDGTLDEETRKNFLERVLAPQASTS